MRLDWVSIPRYKNLRDFRIDFDEEQSTTVLLGRNGSGKSNLVEAIVEIFRDIELNNPPAFEYILQYVCRDHIIKLDADPSRGRKLEITVDNEPIARSTFQKSVATYLPNYLFAYYSGWSSRLEHHFDEPTRVYYREILNSKGDEMPLRRLFFCRKEYSQLVLLAFFLAEPPGASNLLEKYLGIRSFDSALFVMKTPWWGGGKRPNKIMLEEGDPRFWYARGSFKTFLDRLWRFAFAPIRNKEAVERDIRRQGEVTERLYLFIKDLVELANLKTAQEDAKTLFGYLESLFLCDLIDEVRVTVERTDGTRVKFTQLSEGEQQLLTVLGLLLFTQNDESLYLLDEPDTHLNPVWTYGFLDLLQKNISAEKGQLLIATHNPLMIGSLYKNQVRIITQEAPSAAAYEPEYDPIGIGIEGLLKSELYGYGLRSTLAPEILERLDRHYELLGKKDRSEDEQMELMKLARELNELAVVRSYPNPYFDQFASAMAKRAPEPSEELSKADIERQSHLADEILAEVVAEDEARPEGDQR